MPTPIPPARETRRPPQCIALIVNPVSGAESGNSRRERLRRRAEATGLNCEWSETDALQGAMPLAKQAVAEGRERVIVYGGDGTVAEAAEAVAGTETALAVLPGGTGNLLAVNLHLPLDPEEALHVALSGNPTRLDVGRANGRAFLIVAGIGADARMIQKADRAAKRRLGPFAYFWAAGQYLRLPLNRYRITVDGRTYVRRAVTVMVANLGRITGGVELIPGCDPYDGRLEVAILRTRSFGEMLNLAIRALLGWRRNDNLMEVLQGRHIVIETPHPLPVQLDGNEAPSTTRLEVHVEPGALRLVSPSHVRETSPPAKEPTMGAFPFWLPLLAGWGSGWWTRKTLLSRHGRPADRSPWLVGLIVGGLLTLALASRARHQTAKTTAAADDADQTSPDL